MDPHPMADPHHHMEYSWTLSWYAGLDSDHLREAQEIDQLRRQESDGWSTITAFEQEANYPEGELRRDIEHAGLFNARSVLVYILESLGSLPRSWLQNGTAYDGRYLREIMSPEEKLFELQRVGQLPRTSELRYCLNVLRELDNSALAFYRNRSTHKLIRIGERSLWISRRKAEELDDELNRLIWAQAGKSFAVRITTGWRQREIQRRVTELREQTLRYRRTGERYYLYPSYLIDSKIVFDPQQILPLPTTHYEKLLEQAETLLDRVEKKTTCRPDGKIRVCTLTELRTLEERAYVQYRLNSGQGKPDVITEESAILVATRLSREGHELPFLRLNEVLAKYGGIREQLQETLRRTHKEISRP